MNIPPPKERRPFKIEILKGSDEITFDDNQRSNNLICDVDDSWFHQICLQFKAKNHEKNAPKPENAKLSQNQEKINEYKQTIHSLTVQNKELCNLDFENMDISEIDAEISKIKRVIKGKEDHLKKFPEKIKEYRGRIERGHETDQMYRNKINALYNEICSWSDPLLIEKFGEDEKNPQYDLFNLNDLSERNQGFTMHLRTLKK